MRGRTCVGTTVVLAMCLVCVRAAVGQSGIVAYWPLNDGLGTVATDVFGGNNGTLVGAPSWVAGRFGSGLSFDRTNRYVDLPVAIANSMKGSVSFWINTTQDFSLPPDMSGHVFYGTETNGDGYGDRTGADGMEHFERGAIGEHHRNDRHVVADGRHDPDSAWL